MKAFQVISILLALVYFFYMPVFEVVRRSFPDAISPMLSGYGLIVQALCIAFFWGLGVLLMRGNSRNEAVHAERETGQDAKGQPVPLGAFAGKLLMVIFSISAVGLLGLAARVAHTWRWGPAEMFRVWLSLELVQSVLETAFFVVSGWLLVRSGLPRSTGMKTLGCLGLVLAVVAAISVYSGIYSQLTPVASESHFRLMSYVNLVHLAASAAFFGIVAYRPEWLFGRLKGQA